MFRRTALGAAAILTTGLMALGCGSDGDTIQTFVVRSAFPGTPVSQSFVGDDGRSLSNSGEDVNDAAFFPNVSNTSGLLFYVTAGNHLMGSFYDGSRFSAPVQITAENYDPTFALDPDAIQVVFVNRSGAGNGRAVIALRWRELGVADDDASTVEDDAKGNIRLMMVLHEAGRFTVGEPVDDDTRDTNTDSDEDVLGFLAVSDSRRFSYAEGEGDESGEATSEVWLTWTADDGAATDEETTFYAKEVDLDTGDLGARQEIVDGGDSGADVFVVAAHNFTVFFVVADDDGNLMLRYTQLNLGLASAQVSRDDGDNNARVDIEEFGPELLFGADHGLARTEGFYEESGFGDDTDSGEPSEDTDAMAFVIDPSTAATAASVQTTEIDAYQGNADSVDHFADVSELEARLTRDRDGYMVAWLQASDVDPSVDRQVIPIGTVVLTNRTGTDPADITALANRVTNTVELSDLTDPTDNTGAVYEFQAGLADGTAGPECNVQSNPNRGYILAEQGDNFDSAGDETQVLYVAGLEATTTGGTTTVTRITPRTIATIEQDWLANAGVENAAAGVWTGNWGIDAAEAFDNGNGDVGVVYLHQANEATNDIADGASDDDFSEPRVFLNTGASGTSVLIGSHAPVNTLNGRVAVLEEPQLAILGVSRFTGNNPNGGGNQVVFVFEERDLTVGDNVVISSRTWDIGAANGSNPPTLENQFYPPLGNVTPASRTEANLPFRVDTGAESDAETVFVLPVNGKAHLYFTQGGHLWWNETSGNGWRQTGGLSDPQLLDNYYRNSLGVIIEIGFQNGSDPRCDADLIWFYTKEIEPNNGVQSLLARDAK